MKKILCTLGLMTMMAVTSCGISDPQIDRPTWCNEWKNISNLSLDYSDVKGSAQKDFYPLFSPLEPNTYYILEQSDARYALIRYEYAEYGVVIEHLNNVKSDYKKEDNTNTLELSLDVEYKQLDNSGEAPNCSDLYLLIKLENEIDDIHLTSEDRYLSRYTGGEVIIGDKAGLLGADMEIVMPAEYSSISKLETGDEAQYYLARTEGGAGILNEDYEWLITPDLGYDFFYYVDGKFSIGEKLTDDMQYVLYVIDDNGQSTGKEISGSLYQSLDCLAFDNEEHLTIIEQDLTYGVINSNLDVVIPIEYKHVSAQSDHSAKDGSPITYYVCENVDGKCAIFLTDGTMLTDFIYENAYEAINAKKEL